MLGAFGVGQVLLSFVLNGSILLKALSVGQVLLSFPVALYFFVGPMGHTSFGILNFVGLWIVFGIGADDIFVFHDTWAQSRRIQVRRARRWLVDAVAPHPGEKGAAVGSGRSRAASR
jgi:hypothetical protein